MPVEGNEGTCVPELQASGLVPAPQPALWHSFSLRSGTNVVVVVIAVFGLLNLLVASRGSARPEVRELSARRLTDDGIPKHSTNSPSPLVSDGASLFFTERRDNQTMLAQVAIDGRQMTAHPGPLPDAALTDYSRPKHSLLIGSAWSVEESQPLMVKDVRTGQLNPVGAIHAHDASWSPDGERIAFTRGGSLQIAKADGSEQRQLATGEGVIFWPRWSPDGRRLRFSENYGGNRTELWEVNADGGNLHLLVPTEATSDHVCCGMWSGDGRWYFYKLILPGQSSLWALSEQDGTKAEPQLVVPSNDMDWEGPLVSQDGRKLWTIASDRTAELVRVNAKTRTLEAYMAGYPPKGLAFRQTAHLWLIRRFRKELYGLRASMELAADRLRSVPRSHAFHAGRRMAASWHSSKVSLARLGCSICWTCSPARCVPWCRTTRVRAWQAGRPMAEKSASADYRTMPRAAHVSCPFRCTILRTIP